MCDLRTLSTHSDAHAHAQDLYTGYRLSSTDFSLLPGTAVTFAAFGDRLVSPSRAGSPHLPFRPRSEERRGPTRFRHFHRLFMFISYDIFFIEMHVFRNDPGILVRCIQIASAVRKMKMKIKKKKEGRRPAEEGREGERGWSNGIPYAIPRCCFFFFSSPLFSPLPFFVLRPIFSQLQATTPCGVIPNFYSPSPSFLFFLPFFSFLPFLSDPLFFPFQFLSRAELL